MNCQDVAKFLQVFIDGELDKEDNETFFRHLESCPSCRTLADYERRFQNAVKARIPKAKAPRQFRQKLIKRMNVKSKQRIFSRRLVFSAVPALVIILVVIPFTWTVTSGFSSLVNEAVERHSFAPPVELNSSDSEQVEKWFRKKVPFNVAIPRFRAKKMNLIGARLSYLARNRAALVRYQRGGHNFSLFVVDDPGGDMDGKFCKKVRAKEFCINELKGYTVVIWRSRGLAYSLVGDEAPQEMLQVIDTAFNH